MPGWTDTLGLLQVFSLMVGLGVLKDVEGRGDGTADVIPVDYVAKQILVSVPYLVQRNQQTKGQANLLITQCATSSDNPTSWANFFNSVITYQNNFPYNNRAGAASLTFHST